MRPSPLLPLLVLLATAAPAVLVDSGNGAGNTSAPSPDPGWNHVGLRGGLTAVYLGSGAMLTADHVGAGNVSLGGVYYSHVPGSAVQLENPDGSPAALLLFAVTPDPPLPDLEISSTPPLIGTPLVLIGNGRNRGATTTWGSTEGYLWDPGKAMRWGTNFVEAYPLLRILGTEAFASYFDEGGSAHEAQGAVGDSGGAAFAWTGSGWELAGLLYAISIFSGQPNESSLYGQATYAADLSIYRDQIETWKALPEPRGGLGLGVVLLAGLAAGRRSRASGFPRASRRSRPSSRSR